ncbi:MAG: ABC transporter substrate-binding protein [Oscillospiraceae bacterium]
MKKKLKVSSLIALMLVIALVASACGSSGGGGSSQPDKESPKPAESAPAPADEPAAPASTAIAKKMTPEDTLVYAISSTDDNFDPADTVQDWASVIFLMYETLIYTDSHGNVYPCLATDWKWSEDYKTLHFTLREGVKFSNGYDLTGSDVLYSLKRASATRMGGAMLSQIDFDQSYYEGNNVYLVLKAPNSEYLPYFARTFCGIISEKYFEEKGSDYATLNPVGTGPYIMTDFVEGESVSFERNENYWGEPDYKNVKIKVVLEESTRALAFSAGEVDAAILNFADNAVTFEGRESEGIRVNTTTGSLQYFLSIGDFPEAIPDVTVRKAIAHAVDWPALVQAVWGNYATVADSSAPVTSSYYHSIGIYEYDPELSKQLLAEAGYPDGLTLEMAAASNSVDVTVLTIIQDYLADVGIKLNLTVTDNATARQMSASGQVDMSLAQNSSVSGTLTELWDPHLAGSGSLINEVHSDNWEIGATFQNMVKEYYGIFDETEKQNKAKEIQQYIYDNVLWIPIANLSQIIISFDYLENMDYFIGNWVVNTGPNLRALTTKSLAK